MYKTSPLTQYEQRAGLGEISPLPFPLSASVYVSHACNFKCFYCLQSTPREELSPHTIPAFGRMLSLETFRALMDNIRQYGRLKCLILTGHGEPLLNPQVSDIVRYARDIDVAERIELVTNASLLTPELSDLLIDAGLTKLRVSLQGINAEQYLSTAGVQLDMDRFVENIRYFYQHRGRCEVLVKIMDVMLTEPSFEERFHQMFSEITTRLNIESLVPVPNVDLDGKGVFETSKLGYDVESVKICSQAFFTPTIDINGDVYPCCLTVAPVKLGNCVQDDFSEIWMGDVHRRLLTDFLEHRREQYEACRDCRNYQYMGYLEDRLEGYEQDILRRMKDFAG